MNAVNRPEFVRRTLIVAGITLGLAALALAFVRAYDIFFLFFAAILLAILLRSAADALARWTRVGTGWALAAVLVLLVILFAAGAYLAGTVAVNQFWELSTELPRSVEQARSYLEKRPWGRAVLEQVSSLQGVAPGGASQMTGRITSFFSTTFGILGNIVVLVFLTIYLAVSPSLYVDGTVRLVPPPHRDRARAVLAAIGYHLRWWLIGRLVAMLVVGVITLVGLWAVGVPQYLALALLATILTAVPFIGPIVAAVPGILLGLMQGPDVALWALAVYVLAQAVENYLVTPLIQQRTVSLPPVVTIAAITLVGALFGVLGLIVATPLAVTILVAVKMLYVEDVLGDDLNVPGSRPST